MIQQSLFERPTLNIAIDIKENLSAAVKKSVLSREEVVDQMNRLAARNGVCLVQGAGKRLTMDTFEKWINPSDLSRQMPLKVLPIFCAVVKDTSVLDLLARTFGLMLVGHEDQRLLRWAKAYRQERQARQAKRKLESELF